MLLSRSGREPAVRTEAGLLHDMAAELCSERPPVSESRVRASSVAAGENLFALGLNSAFPDGGWVFERRSCCKAVVASQTRASVNARRDYPPSIPAETPIA